MMATPTPTMPLCFSSSTSLAAEDGSASKRGPVVSSRLPSTIHGVGSSMSPM